MGSTYVHPDVAAVRRLHAALYARGAGGGTRSSWVEHQTQTLLEAHAAGDPAATIQIRAVVPQRAHDTPEQILDTPLTADEAFAAIALEHGFDDPSAVDETTLDLDFEVALDTIEAGDLAAFRRLLERVPHLPTMRSAFGHGATLLHYLSANGVEIARQGVPHDAPRFAMALIEAGADPTATARAYGGDHTVRALFETSAHPISAGVDAEFRHVLEVSGA